MTLAKVHRKHVARPTTTNPVAMFLYSFLCIALLNTSDSLVQAFSFHGNSFNTVQQQHSTTTATTKQIATLPFATTPKGSLHCLQMQPSRQGRTTELFDGQPNGARGDPLQVSRATTLEFETETTVSPSSLSSATELQKTTAAPGVLDDMVLPVLWTSLLVTSNTVGAGMLVLPELCVGPGMGISMGLFSALYVANLLSGLIIAQVAVQQREASGKDAPSSFKAFSEVSFADVPYATDVIAFVSVVKNALVLAFGTMKAGELGHEILGLDPTMGSIVWATAFSSLVGTQTALNLSKVASCFVVGLFASFAAILLPGLANIHDPMSVLMAPGTAGVVGDASGATSSILDSALYAAPIILMSFIFQNIVPTVARVLEYDRTKIAATMIIGSFLPFLMYMAWCLAVVGGGVDTSVGLDGPLFTAFSIVTIAGSQLGSTTSMAEEVETYLPSSSPQAKNKISSSDKEKDDSALGGTSTTEDRTNLIFSWESVAIPTLLALGLGQVFANNLNDLLKIAGSYGSPFLYFFLPAVMAFRQQQEQQSTPSTTPSATGGNMVPGGNASLAISALVAAGFVTSEIYQSFAHS